MLLRPYETIEDLVVVWPLASRSSSFSAITVRYMGPDVFQCITYSITVLYCTVHTYCPGKPTEFLWPVDWLHHGHINLNVKWHVVYCKTSGPMCWTVIAKNEDKRLESGQTATPSLLFSCTRPHPCMVACMMMAVLTHPWRPTRWHIHTKFKFSMLCLDLCLLNLV